MCLKTLTRVPDCLLVCLFSLPPSPSPLRFCPHGYRGHKNTCFGKERRKKKRKKKSMGGTENQNKPKHKKTLLRDCMRVCARCNKSEMHEQEISRGERAESRLRELTSGKSRSSLLLRDCTLYFPQIVRYYDYARPLKVCQ